MATYNAPQVEGGVLDLSYTGVVDTINILKSGIYKLEGWGANGGEGWLETPDEGYRAYGGSGGYFCYYALLKKGVIYAALGRAGDTSPWASGYNTESFNGGGGGGYGTTASDIGHVGSGGGATHFATMTGTIAQIGKANLGKILCIAGGGGGADPHGAGGAGGGLTSGAASGGTAATQTSGGRPTGHYETSNGEFGQGGNGGLYCGNGGGGLYGGCGSNTGGGSGASGGSGYLAQTTTTFQGVTYTNSMQTGIWRGNGKAKITMVKKAIPLIYYGTKQIDAISYNTKDISNIFYGAKQL